MNNRGVRLAGTILMAVLLLALGALAIDVAPAEAAGNVTDCSTYGPGAGTLQEALVDGGTVTFTCSDTIIVPEIIISADTPTVIDATSQTVTLSGNNANRVFRVNSGKSLTLRNITVANGSFDGWGAGANVAAGGSLTVENSTFTGNAATGEGGAIYSEGTLVVTDSTITGNSAEHNGGGIYAYTGSTTTIQGSTLSGNAANGSGGGIVTFGTLLITNSTISGNTSSGGGGGGGGGLNVATGNAVLNNVTLTANHADEYGGGIRRYSTTSVSLSNTIVAGNTAGNGGPDLFGTITSLGYNLIGDTTGATFTPGTGDITGVDPLLGPLADNGGPTRTHALLFGSPAINAGDTTLTTDQRGEPRPALGADDIGTYELQDCGDNWSVATEVELNQAIACYNGKPAAGSYTITLTADITLTLSTSAIGNATAGVELVVEGDGYAVDGQGSFGNRPFTIDADTTVTFQNLTITGGNRDYGGGISNGGTLTVLNSTIHHNHANEYGGGIDNYGTLYVVDSTLSHNVSSNQTNGGLGGGIFNGGHNGTLTVVNSTISDNEAFTSGGGIENAFDGTLTLHNSIVANNTAFTDPDCDAIGDATGQNSLVEVGSSCFGSGTNNLNGDPNLGPLQDNGGPTWTHALLSGSIAINAGDDALAVDPDSNPLPYDQRGSGYPRILSAAVDMGAYEAEVYTLTVSRDGTGSGTVTSTPAGIDCGTDCSESFTAGTVVTLTATADTGSTFSGWSGDCSGTGMCVVTMDAAKSVTATFELATQPGPNFVVNSSADTDDGSCDLLGQGIGNQDCTLREAINAANAQTGADTITFDIPAADGGCTAANACTITLTSALPTLVEAVTIDGAPNNGHITIDANGNRAFWVDEAGDDFSFNALEIKNGSAFLTAGGIEVTVGNVLVSNSTFVNNSAASGGHIKNIDGTVVVVNSTFFDAPTTGIGNTGTNGSIAMYNSTIDGNGQDATGVNAGNGTITLYNTIVTNQGINDCYATNGTVIADGYNIDEDGTCGDATSKTYGELALYALADNGGPTRTMALGVGSAALDTGDDAVCAAAPVNNLDQRGVTRPQGAGCDVGAYEAEVYTIYLPLIFNNASR